MSQDDFNTEHRQAASVTAATGLPLVGLTAGNDGAWSARFWHRTAPKTYRPSWCENVRVIGEQGLSVTFANSLLPPPDFREELIRTVSAWGNDCQGALARLRFGVVGTGSVGAMVGETLARMGIQHIRLIDFDFVERHNLDRLLHVTVKNLNPLQRKVDVIGQALESSATAAKVRVDKLPLAVTEEDGFRAALDCDVLFSCVDRPWPRHVLNFIAFAHLIPVVDGGILIRVTKEKKLRSASWRTSAVYPGKRCLLCVGQYDPSFVNVERRGDLDDPIYIQGLPNDHILRRNENVFPFSSHLAASQVMQMLHFTIHPAGLSNMGEHVHHFVGGTVERSSGIGCDTECLFPSLEAQGDRADFVVTGFDHGADRARKRWNARPTPRPAATKLSFGALLNWLSSIISR